MKIAHGATEINGALDNRTITSSAILMQPPFEYTKGITKIIIKNIIILLFIFKPH